MQPVIINVGGGSNSPILSNTTTGNNMIHYVDCIRGGISFIGITAGTIYDSKTNIYTQFHPIVNFSGQVKLKLIIRMVNCSTNVKIYSNETLQTTQAITANDNSDFREIDINFNCVSGTELSFKIEDVQAIDSGSSILLQLDSFGLYVSQDTTSSVNFTETT